jgi:hypothetical protein
VVVAWFAAAAVNAKRRCGPEVKREMKFVEEHDDQLSISAVPSH